MPDIPPDRSDRVIQQQARRAERLAQELRANLKRRKAARPAKAAPESETITPDTHSVPSHEADDH